MTINETKPRDEAAMTWIPPSLVAAFGLRFLGGNETLLRLGSVADRAAFALRPTVLP